MGVPVCEGAFCASDLPLGVLVADTERYQFYLDEPHSGSDKDASRRSTGEASDGVTASDRARGALVNDAFAPSTISSEAQQKFGLQVRTAEGKTEFYYRAGGQDHVVLISDQGDSGVKTQELEPILQREMRDLESKYKIKFAVPGEFVDTQVSQGSDCKTHRGEQIRAVQPKFTDVYAMREALEHSTPSQLATDGDGGIKVYFLDKNLLPKPVYGDKPALGVYIPEDKDKLPAVYVTPEGSRLPPTLKDVTEANGRNLAYVIEHELIHNSQRNLWAGYPRVPAGLPETFGWSPLQGDSNLFYGLKGNNGEKYFNMPMGCGQNTAWVAIKDQQMIGNNGQLVLELEQAKRFTYDEVRGNAVVLPPTYYFSNPKEMFAEGLTNFRTNIESRLRLYRVSPVLYDVVKKHDEQEIDRFYGRSVFGYSQYVRALNGAVVPRTSPQAKEVEAFESGLRKGVLAK